MPSLVDLDGAAIGVFGHDPATPGHLLGRLKLLTPNSHAVRVLV